MNYSFKGYPLRQFLGDNIVDATSPAVVLGAAAANKFYMLDGVLVAINYRKRPLQNGLEERFICVPPSVEFFGYESNFNFIDTKSYFDTFDVLTSPRDYIELLCRAPVTGVSFDKSWEEGPIWNYQGTPQQRRIIISDIDSQGYTTGANPKSYYQSTWVGAKGETATRKFVGQSKIFGNPLPYGGDYGGYIYNPSMANFKTVYDIMISRFEEVAVTFAIKEALSDLSVSQVWDINSVQQTLTTTLNRIIPMSDNWLNAQYPVQLFSSGSLIGTKNVTISQEYKDKIRQIWQTKVIPLMTPQLISMAAQYKKVLDPQYRLTKEDIAYITDTSRNPLLTFDPVQSKSAGYPVFRHIGQALTPDIIKYQEAVAAPQLATSLVYYQEAPQTLQNLKRIGNITGGGSYSAQDLTNWGLLDNKKSPVPILILGAAAIAAIASQV